MPDARFCSNCGRRETLSQHIAMAGGAIMCLKCYLAATNDADTPTQDKRNIRNAIFVSDLHIGCQLGLVHPAGAALDGGGTYTPSRLQLKLWTYWEELWDDWVPKVTRGEEFDVIIVGDLMDGRHHRSTTQWSQNLADQPEHAEIVLAPIKARAARLYVLRGTDAHAGEAGENEEKLARQVGAVPNDLGQHARFELWKRVGNDDGPLCHVLHHIGVTGRQAYESSAPQAELIGEITEAGRNQLPPPDFSIRAHRHRFIKVLNPTRRHEAAAIVLPGWQLKTPFVYRTAGGRIMEPQFGGILVRQGDEEFYSRHCYWDIGRPRVEQ